MSIQRPTCHESWFRVRDLRVALRHGVQIHKQHFRGRPWRIVQDPASQDYFRLSEPGYRFVGLLDGRRTVQEAWEIASEGLGDEAPTQGEAIQLLGQLWSSNLIVGDVSPDVGAMLRRGRMRRERELKGKLSSLLSLRIPLFDPDRLLSGLASPLRWIFSPFGFVIWLALVASGLWQMAGRWDEIARAAQGALAPENLAWLYATFVVLKLMHEVGHGLACKVFGKREGSGGEVHAIGIMLLVLLPVPYVDATSAWGLRSKWRRITVGAAGMMTELLLASIAAWIWSRAGAGTTLSIVSANAILIAGVSTLLFNANPLLRYDGYYILSDLLETPNLQQRSRDLVHALVKLRVFGVRGARSAIATAAQTPGERALLVTYWITSTIYRLFITVAIILFIAGQLFFIGVVLALMALVAWFVLPVIKFGHYLISNPELDRVRPRALATSLATIALIAALVGLVPAPQRVHAQGFVDAPRSTVVRALEPGVVMEITPRGEVVTANQALVRTDSLELRSERERWDARLAQFDGEYRKALADDPARAAIVREQRDAAAEEIRELDDRIASLSLRSAHEGEWRPDESRLSPGAYLERGAPLGMIVDAGELIVRFEIDQDAAALLLGREGEPIALRPISGAGRQRTGSIERIVEAGREAMQADGVTPAPRTFELIASLDVAESGGVLPGLPLMGMIELEPEPIGSQGLRALRRVLQERFGL